MFEVIAETFDTDGSVISSEVMHVAASGVDAHAWVDDNSGDGIHYRVAVSPFISANEPAYVFLPWHMAIAVQSGNLLDYMR